MPIWVPFATAILGALLGALLTAHRESKALKRDAIAKFRSAFAEAITQIDHKDAHLLMSQAKVAHDVAIYDFRRFVRSARLASFDEAVSHFHQCRSAQTPAAIVAFKALGSGQPIDKSDIAELKKALNELLVFADEA